MPGSATARAVAKAARAATRMERENRGHANPGIAHCEFHLAAQAACLAVDERDAVAAVFREIAFRVADDEHVGQQHEPHRAEVAAVDMEFQRRRSIVVARLGHLSDVHHGDVAASTVLQELVVVDRAVVVDHVRGLPVLARSRFAGSPSSLPSRRSSAVFARLTMAFGVLLFPGSSASFRSMAYMRGSRRPVARMNVLSARASCARHSSKPAASTDSASSWSSPPCRSDDSLLARSEGQGANLATEPCAAGFIASRALPYLRHASAPTNRRAIFSASMIPRLTVPHIRISKGPQVVRCRITRPYRGQFARPRSSSAQLVWRMPCASRRATSTSPRRPATRRAAMPAPRA